MEEGGCTQARQEEGGCSQARQEETQDNGMKKVATLKQIYLKQFQILMIALVHIQIFMKFIYIFSDAIYLLPQLHLTIPQLPQTSSYTCVFLELDWSSPVSFWYFGAICKTPDFNKLGLSLGMEGFRTVTLALNSTETGKLFVTKSFTFYNCSNFHR